MHDNSRAAYSVLSDDGKTLALGFSGVLDEDAYANMRKGLDSLLAGKKFTSLSLDLAGVTRLDDSGALLLAHLFRKAEAKKAHCETKNATGSIREVLDMLHFEALVSAPPLAISYMVCGQ